MSAVQLVKGQCKIKKHTHEKKMLSSFCGGFCSSDHFILCFKLCNVLGLFQRLGGTNKVHYTK
jgi:hypothetical protein